MMTKNEALALVVATLLTITVAACFSPRVALLLGLIALWGGGIASVVVGLWMEHKRIRAR